MGTNNDTTLHQLAYVLNKNCSANDLQIYTNGSNEESVGLFHFAHACFLLGTSHILPKLTILIWDNSCELTSKLTSVLGTVAIR